MTELSPHSRKLIALATRAEAPPSSTKQRCERRLQRRLSAAMGLAAGVAVAETAAAHSIAVKSAVMKATLGSGALGGTAAAGSGASLGAGTGALVAQFTALLSSVSAKVVVSSIALAATASLGHELIEQLDSPATKTPAASSAADLPPGTAPRTDSVRGSATIVPGSGLADSDLADSDLADSDLADSDLADSDLADPDLADPDLADPGSLDPGLAGPAAAAPAAAAPRPERPVPTDGSSTQTAKPVRVSPPRAITGKPASAREGPNSGTPHKRSDLIAQVEALEHAERLLHTGQEEAALRALNDSENEHGAATNDLSGERRALRALVLCASQSAERRAAGRAEAARSLALDPRGSLAPRLKVECAQDAP